MQTLERLGAAELVEAVQAYRDLLKTHQAHINRLNVYPVPDGDTGTNMALTVESVAEEIASATGSDLAAVAHALAHGSLMGARGNSGVILSQILRGLAAAFAAGDGIDGSVLSDGLRRAREGAYQAVQNPVEGTMLTVMAAAAAAAGGLGPHASLLSVLDGAKAAADDALARTPELLPVLARAGVVDSGGAGLVLLFDALLHIADGRPLPPAPSSPTAGSAAALLQRVDPRVGSDPVVLGGEGPRYEVMYLLEAPDETIPAFRSVWAGLGDSIVVVGGNGLWNCHIHTDDIGPAVEAALDAGRPRRIRVSDLHDQVEEERWVRDAGPSSALPDDVEERLGCAVVAVCTGEGVRRIFRSLGVSRLVDGGQSMNPSTVELLAAVEDAPAEQVVILPNNKNIVAVARAAASSSTKVVTVVPTRDIPEGFAALLEYDPQGDAEANARLMGANVDKVVAGEVTQAVRDSGSEVGPIRAGQYIGLSRHGIVAVGDTVVDAATALLNRLIDIDHHEIVTVIAGEGSTPADTRRVTEWLAEHHPDVAAEVHHGGQPLYPYLFSLE